MACSRWFTSGKPAVTVRHITAEHYFLSPVSNTFHGRDIFAPVAAWLAKTYQTEAMGEEITDYIAVRAAAGQAGRSALKGVVLRVDVFGNLMTNFTAGDLPAATIAERKNRPGGRRRNASRIGANLCAGRGGRADRDPGIERLPRDRGEQGPRCAGVWG